LLRGLFPDPPIDILIEPVSLYLTSTEERAGGAPQRIYRATTAGARAPPAAKLKVRVFDDEADQP
jgi:hypothetical protein